MTPPNLPERRRVARNGDSARVWSDQERNEYYADVRFKRLSAKAAYVLMGIGVIIALWLLVGNQRDLARIGQENRDLILKQDVQRRDSRDQICEGDEREHRRNVEGLRLTYQYVLELDPDERNEPINKLIISQIPAAEQDAYIDQAPDFCDEKGIGEPEPDPTVPARPKAIDDLLPPGPPYIPPGAVRGF